MRGKTLVEASTPSRVMAVARDLRDRWKYVELLPAAGVPVLAAYASLLLAQSTLPLALAYATGDVVADVPALVGSGLSSAAGKEAVAAFARLAVVLVVMQLVEAVLSVVTMRVSQRIDADVQRRVMKAASRPTGIRMLEDPATHDEVGRTAVPVGVVALALPVTISRYITSFSSVAIVAQASTWLAVVLVGIVLHQRLYWRRKGIDLTGCIERSQPAERRAGHIAELMTTPGAAKEVRVFGLGNWLVDRHREAWAHSVRERWQWGHDLARGVFVSIPVRAAGFGFPFVVLAHHAATGRIGVGTLITCMIATGTAVGWGVTPEDMNMALYGGGHRAVRALEARATRAREAPMSDALPVHASEAIRFEAVRFAYPGQATPVYDALDLVVPVGCSLAVVGANGAGKTTLFKLLGRLYEPDDGRITVDGVDIRSHDVEAWRRELAVVFQDFLKFPFTVRENIGLGALDRMHDEDALRRVAAQAGVLDLIEALPHGWETVLSPQFSGGVDLSGGQWQRIALARALFAVEGGARVLVLDEPTANLDVRAEAELFRDFVSTTQGLTRILVSHRFSTVRWADRICVLDAGRVVEDGTHEELLALGGRYATMFRLQADRFAAADDATEEQASA